MSDIVGIDKLISKITKLEHIPLNNVLNKACIIVENSAKINCPVGQTGELRQSLTHEVDGDIGVVGTNLEYAPYVEFGTGLFSSLGTGRKDVPWKYQDAKGDWYTTSGQHPQPYLLPALQNNTDRVQNVINTELLKELNKICLM